MLYTEDFTTRHYVGFSQIGSHMPNLVQKWLMVSCYFNIVAAAAVLPHLHHSGVTFISNNIKYNVICHILCMGLSITTTSIADEWLYKLIICDNNKCITVNGQVIIYVDA